jgi:hypothetical protein
MPHSLIGEITFLNLQSEEVENLAMNGLQVQDEEIEHVAGLKFAAREIQEVWATRREGGPAHAAC